MATILYKPNLYLVPAFDAKKDFIFTFAYLGGSVFKNTILIKNNETNQEIYRHTETTRQLRQTVPSDTLTNGRVYNVSIQIIDGDNNVSQFSDPIVIYCFTTPTFNFVNLVENQIITASYFETQLNYNQIENERLNQYTFILYNSNKVELYNSGNLYNTSILKTLIPNLVNGNYYYLRAIGKTMHNMDVDTGYVFFNVRYINPPVYTLLGLENKADVGAISISPHLIVITGTSKPNPPKYINNIEVDLREKGSYVEFEKGFNISNDFTLQLIGRAFNDYSDIIILDNKSFKIVVSYRKGVFDGQNGEKAYFQVKAYNSLTNYVLLSNYINVPNINTNIYIWLRRKGAVYELKCEIL